MTTGLKLQLILQLLALLQVVISQSSCNSGYYTCYDGSCCRTNTICCRDQCCASGYICSGTGRCLSSNPFNPSPSPQKPTAFIPGLDEAQRQIISGALIPVNMVMATLVYFFVERYRITQEFVEAHLDIVWTPSCPLSLNTINELHSRGFLTILKEIKWYGYIQLLVGVAALVGCTLGLGVPTESEFFLLAITLTSAHLLFMLASSAFFWIFRGTVLEISQKTEQHELTDSRLMRCDCWHKKRTSSWSILSRSKSNNASSSSATESQPPPPPPPSAQRARSISLSIQPFIDRHAPSREVVPLPFIPDEVIVEDSEEG